MKFDENPPSGNGDFSCGRTDRQNMMKPIVAFCNFAKAPKSENFSKLLNL